MNSEIIEWLAFAIGTVGTIAWATGYKYKNFPVEGFFWLISALVWVYFAIITNHNGLVARDILGIILYVIGIVKSIKDWKKNEL